MQQLLKEVDEKAEELAENKAEAERRHKSTEDLKSEKRKAEEEKTELARRLEASTSQLDDERQRWQEESTAKDAETERFVAELEKQINDLRATIKEVYCETLMPR